MFQSPIAEVNYEGNNCRIVLDKPLVCSNYIGLLKVLSQIPIHIKEVSLELTPAVIMKDHTTFENIENFMKRFNEKNDRKITLIGNEGLKRVFASRKSTQILDIEHEMLTSVG